MFLLTHAQADLSDVVAIWHRQAQLSTLPQQAGLHLMAHYFQRGMVHDQMMELQPAQPALVWLIPGMYKTHHRRPTNVQTLVAGVETLVQLCRDVAALRVRLKAFTHQQRLTPDHLHRFVQPLPDQCGAQNVMALDHELQGAGKVVDMFLAVEGEQRLQQIRISTLGAEVVIEDAFLQRRQRVDVLHIRHAARHAGDHLVDLRLGQVGQRQQVRGDVFAVLGNQIGGHHDFRAAANCCCQRRQRRLTEQHAYVRAQARLTHTPDQADGQQRMTAQLEEVVVTTDLSNA
ncbi:Uncharacterized protein ABJ98_2035 [Pseudomonas syringae pv. aceris]|nr:Uncharacterized protein ABJ98_2035 [Pseudomonas syringae pv. aceris]